MKKAAFLLILAALPLSLACAPKKPQIPLTTVPAGPALKALEQRGRAFSSLNALASVEIVKGGRRRSFETVGIVVDDRRRFRMEAFGPLGQSLAAIVWNGQELLLRLPEEDRVTATGQSVLSRLLGDDLDPAEFCAVLSGTVRGVAEATQATMQCAPGGDCILELHGDAVVRRARLSGEFAAGPPHGLRLESYELIRSGTVVFRALFNVVAIVNHYPLPMHITIENPDKKTRFVVVYNEADVNVPVFDDAFSLTDVVSGAPDK